MTLAQIGTIAASLGAALIAIFGIIVVRGTKISEFRQKWIDEQRQDLSALLANAARLSVEPNIKRAEYLLAFDVAAIKIQLRENPKTPEWTEVLDQIGNLRTLINANPPRVSDISEHSASIVTLSRIRLKAEWGRVRFGELGYRIFYRTVVTIIVILFTIAIVWTILYAYYSSESLSL